MDGTLGPLWSKDVIRGSSTLGEKAYLIFYLASIIVFLPAAVVGISFNQVISFSRKISFDSEPIAESPSGKASG